MKTQPGGGADDLLPEAERFFRHPEPEEGPEEGSTIILMRGLTEESGKALGNRDTVIRSFPFRIGRITQRFSLEFFDENDLNLPDLPPFHVSRTHLALERRGEELFIRDLESTNGFVLDGKRMGANVDGRARAPLKGKAHELTVGGPRSPFRFSLILLRADDDEVPPIVDTTRFGGRVISVELLYLKICAYTEQILAAREKELPPNIEDALVLISKIMEERRAIDDLCYYAANPSTFPELIVAHTVNTFIYALKLGRDVGLKRDELLEIGHGALFHDIGLYDISPSIVEKRSQLNEEEFEVLKGHCHLGYRRLSQDSNPFPAVAEKALLHHERFNGSGYPKGLVGDEIDLPTQIVGIADHFESLTHWRLQRGPVTPHEGVKKLIEEGKEMGLFSPEIVKHFVDSFSLYPPGTYVKLNSGEIGQVVASHPDWPLRPVVKIIYDRHGMKVRADRRVDLLSSHLNYIKSSLELKTPSRKRRSPSPEQPADESSPIF